MSRRPLSQIATAVSLDYQGAGAMTTSAPGGNPVGRCLLAGWAALALAACGSSVQHEVLGPGLTPGTLNVMITCRKAGACLVEAQRVCSWGFRVAPVSGQVELSTLRGAVIIECITQEAIRKNLASPATEQRAVQPAVPKRCNADSDCKHGCCAQLEGLSARVCVAWSKCPVKLEEEPEGQPQPAPQ
jgi:hypothetical protein